VNRIDVGFAANLPANPEAIMSLGWFPGWVILREDGRDQQLEFLSAVHAALPADAMSSMDVNGGWRLAYRPFSFRAGLFLTALGFLTLGFLIGSRRRGALPLAPDHAKS
jgi:hypothetical protein